MDKVHHLVMTTVELNLHQCQLRADKTEKDKIKVKVFWLSNMTSSFYNKLMESFMFSLMEILRSKFIFTTVQHIILNQSGYEPFNLENGSSAISDNLDTAHLRL